MGGATLLMNAVRIWIVVKNLHHFYFRSARRRFLAFLLLQLLAAGLLYFWISLLATLSMIGIAVRSTLPDEVR